jgi:hypothetical protein
LATVYVRSGDFSDRGADFCTYRPHQRLGVAGHGAGRLRVSLVTRSAACGRRRRPYGNRIDLCHIRTSFMMTGAISAAFKRDGKFYPGQTRIQSKGRMTAVSEIFILGSGGFGTALSIALSEMYMPCAFGLAAGVSAETAPRTGKHGTLKGVRFRSPWTCGRYARISDAELVLVATPSVGVRQTAASIRGLVRPGIPSPASPKGSSPAA